MHIGSEKGTIIIIIFFFSPSYPHWTYLWALRVKFHVFLFRVDFGFVSNKIWSSSLHFKLLKGVFRKFLGGCFRLVRDSSVWDAVHNLVPPAAYTICWVSCWQLQELASNYISRLHFRPMTAAGSLCLFWMGLTVLFHSILPSRLATCFRHVLKLPE
jgi:hypothetical protein